MRVLQEIRNLMGNYHVKSGMYHYFRSEYQQAEEFLHKALNDEDSLSQADRGHARHYLTLSLMDRARKLEAAGDLEQGLDHLRRAAEVNPGFPDIHCRLAGLLEKLGRTDEAIEAYREAIGRHPDYLEAHVALAMCLLGVGRTEEAAEAFRGARDLRRERIERPFREGLKRLAKGETVEAAERFHEAFRVSPRLAEEHLRKADEWVRAEEYERALAELDRASVAHPKYPDIHNFRGIVLFELDRVVEAVEAFGLSVKLSPRYLVPRLNLAFALARAGDLRQSERELESILEQDPTEQAAAVKLEQLRTGRLPDSRSRASRSGAR